MASHMHGTYGGGERCESVSAARRSHLTELREPSVGIGREWSLHGRNRGQPGDDEAAERGTRRLESDKRGEPSE